MENEDLATVRRSLVNIRADLMSYRMLMHALIIQMAPSDRAHLLKHFQDQHAQALQVAQKQDVDEESTGALHAAVERVSIAIKNLPSAF